MRDENARLGVETITRSDLTARSTTQPLIERSLRPALTGTGWKKASGPSKDGEQTIDVKDILNQFGGQDSNLYIARPSSFPGAGSRPCQLRPRSNVSLRWRRTQSEAAW